MAYSAARGLTALVVGNAGGFLGKSPFSFQLRLGRENPSEEV